MAKFLAEKQVIKPSSCRRRYLRIDFTTVPLFAVLLLLATKCINGHDLRRGIVGDGGVKPLSIMTLFLWYEMCCDPSLPRGAEFRVQAYLTISLDATGLFRFLAFWVTNRGGSSGKRLHLYFWVFSLLLAVAVGNVGSAFSLFSRIHHRSGPCCSLRYPIHCVLHKDRRVGTTHSLFEM